MTALGFLTLGLDEGTLGEAIILFLGLLAYAATAVLKKWQERNESKEAAGGEALPGRRRRRTPRGGGEFLGGPPKEAGPPPKRKARDLWRDLLDGETLKPDRPPIPDRRGAPPVARRPEPPSAPVEPEPATLTELGRSLEDLHETLDRRHAELEHTHAGLPSESVASPLVDSPLGGLPSEDVLEEVGGDRLLQGTALTARRSRPRTTRATSSHRRAWRSAVVASELLAPPLALRDPRSAPGRLPG